MSSLWVTSPFRSHPLSCDHKMPLWAPGHVQGRKTREGWTPAVSGLLISKAKACLGASSRLLLPSSWPECHQTTTPSYTGGCEIKYLAKRERNVITDLNQMWFFSWVVADYLPPNEMSEKEVRKWLGSRCTCFYTLATVFC